MEVDGAGPALVWALHHDHVEVAPLTSIPPTPGAAVRGLGRLSTAAGLDLVGRSVDCLGRALDRGGEGDCSALEPIFGRDPAVTGAVGPRLTTGFLAVDLKQVIRCGSSVAVVGVRDHAHHVLRHQRTHGRLCIVASPAVAPRQYLRAQRADLDCIHVAAGPDATPAAQWLVPWTAMAIAANLRAHGEHVVVLLDSVDAWRPHARRFPEHGTWSTQLAGLASRAFATDAGSVTLIARCAEPSFELADAFDRRLDLWRAARGDVEPDGPMNTWQLVRPPIRVASMHVLGGACFANMNLQEVERTGSWQLDVATSESGLRESIDIGRRVRACLQWRPGATVDSTEQTACLFAIRHLPSLPEAAVPLFSSRYLAALRDRHAALLQRVRHDGRFVEEEELAVVALAKSVAASMRADEH